MKFEHLLGILGEEPVFETGLLLAGDVDPAAVRVQLARWVKSGRLYSLRRGLYGLAAPYQKVKPHPFRVANQMQPASYVSGQTALAFYGLIPETVQAIMSVTTRRPERLETVLGVFEFRHIQPDLLRGYRMLDLGGQSALVATPEKALLDLVYLQPGGDREEYLRELRLQNLDKIDGDALRALVDGLGIPKLRRAVEIILQLMQNQEQEYEDF